MASPSEDKILQHCFGAVAAGGPATALARLQAASGKRYPVVWQKHAAGGINIGMIRSFVAEIRNHSPALIHIRGLGNEGFHAAVAARIAGVPRILVSVHGTHRDIAKPASRFRRWIVTHLLEPMTLRLATHVTTVCQSAADRDFLQPYSGKLVPPVPNGVPLPPKPGPRDESARRKLGIEPDRLVGVCVSRLTREKGYSDLALALARLNLPQPLDFLIVGGGDESGAIRKLFDGIKNVRVVFAGQQSDVGPYLAAADFFVLPSWHENLSNALLEAMSYGLPVITTDVGANREVLKEGGGIIVAVRSADELSNAIRRIASNDTERLTLGHEARRTIERYYTVQRMVERWEETYAGILRSR